MNFSRDNMWTVLGRLRDCAFEGMSTTEAGPPDRSCIVPGAIVWDDCSCGLLAVSWQLLGAGSTFPVISADTSQTNCMTRVITAQVQIASLRCAASPDVNGNGPTCAELEADALQMLSDAAAVREYVDCCVRTMYTEGVIVDFALGQTLPAGPEGGCDGSTIDVWVGFAAGECCG